MPSAPMFASAKEAMEMARAGLEYSHGPPAWPG